MKPEKPTRPIVRERNRRFRILLRQSTYQPVQTVTDWLDYQAYFEPFLIRRITLAPMDVFPSIRGTNGTSAISMTTI